MTSEIVSQETILFFQWAWIHCFADNAKSSLCIQGTSKVFALIKTYLWSHWTELLQFSNIESNGQSFEKNIGGRNVGACAGIGAIADVGSGDGDI